MKCPNCGYVHNKENAEEVKQKKDRKRAEAAIAALERVIADPSSTLRNETDWYPLRSNVDLLVNACKEEHARLSARLDNPKLLKEIYRRSERQN